MRADWHLLQRRQCAWLIPAYVRQQGLRRRPVALAEGKGLGDQIALLVPDLAFQPLDQVGARGRVDLGFDQLSADIGFNGGIRRDCQICQQLHAAKTVPDKHDGAVTL